MRNKTITVPVALGTLTPITFGKFLAMIPRKEITTGWDAAVEYNVMVSMSVDVADSDSDDFDEEYSSYERRRLYLTLDGSLQKDLLTQAKLTRPWKAPIQDLAEDAVVSHYETFGSGELAVRIGPRTWMIASPSDFCIMVDQRGRSGLACFRQMSLEVRAVHRIAEDEARSLAMDHLRAARERNPFLGIAQDIEFDMFHGGPPLTLAQQAQLFIDSLSKLQTLSKESFK